MQNGPRVDDVDTHAVRSLSYNKHSDYITCDVNISVRYDSVPEEPWNGHYYGNDKKEILQKPTQKQPYLYLHMDQKSDANELSDENNKNSRKTAAAGY
jgi:hypothetical protein